MKDKLLALVAQLDRWQTYILAMLIAFWVAWLFAFLSFINKVGRFPDGAGELLNWLFNLGVQP